MRLGAWRQLLAECRYQIPCQYWPRVLRLTIQSCFNEWLARQEAAQLKVRIEEQEPVAPLFILGFWRSGTTWLQHLLANDPRLATPTGLQVLCPHTFFFLEGLLEERGSLPLARQLYAAWTRWNWGRRPSSAKRTSDNVVVGAHLPGEDEFALLMMGRSDYMAHLLGSEAASHYRRFLTLRSLDPVARQDWVAHWLWFVKKLSLRHGPKILMLKSPSHTARVKTLLKQFPGARFLHIHRHPFEVYRSFTRHLRLLEDLGDVLQKRQPDPHSFCLQLYDEVYSAFLEDRQGIPPGQLYEIDFRQLESKPLETLDMAYEALGLPGFEVCRPRLEDWVRLNSSYQKNVYSPLPPATRALIRTRWKAYFKAFGYENEVD